MSLSGLTFGSEVGLQLLLAPKTSTNIVRAACTVVGIGVPVFSSFKAVEKKDDQEKDNWLVYWSVYGCVTVVETFADKILAWFPYYYHAKVFVLIWLQVPNNYGARYLYDRTLRPVLLRHYDKIDWVVESGRREITRLVQANQKELNYLAGLFQRGAAAGLRTAQDTIRTVAAPTEDKPPQGGPASGPPPVEETRPGAPPPAGPSLEADPVSPKGWVRVPPGGSLDEAEPGESEERRALAGSRSEDEPKRGR